MAQLLCTMKEQQSNEIHKEPNTANNKNELGVVDLFNLNKSGIMNKICSLLHS